MNDRLNATYSKFILESQLQQRNIAAAVVTSHTMTATPATNRTVAGRGRSSAAAASTPNTVSTPVNRAQTNRIKMG